MSYYYNMFLKGIKSKQFFLSVMIIYFSMFISLSSFIEYGIEKFFNRDYIEAFLQGYDGDRTLLTVLAPLIATFPFASRHIENRKSGLIKYMITRMGYTKYFNSIFIINALLSFIVFIFGMSLFLLISILFFNKNINMDVYYGTTNVSIYKNVVKISPLLYVVVIIFHCSIVAIAYSSMGLALSYFIKKKFVALVSPFVISTLWSLFAIFIGLTKMEPMAIFDVSRVKGTSVLFVFTYLIITIGVSYIISYKKFKKDIETDEEI